MTNGQALIQRTFHAYGDTIWPLVYEALSDCPEERELVVLMESDIVKAPSVAVATKPRAIRIMNECDMRIVTDDLMKHAGLAVGADYLLHIVLVTDCYTVVSSIQCYPIQAIGDA